MADEKTAEVVETLDNSEETQNQEQGQQTDSESTGTIAQVDSSEEGATEGSADARTKEQIQASEQYHQSMADTLRGTVAELTQKLSRLTPGKPTKTNESLPAKLENESEEEYVNSEAQLEKVVGRVFDKKFQKLSSTANRTEQMRTIDEAVFQFKTGNNISDDVFNRVMTDYGSLVTLAIDNEGDVPKAATMFLNTLAKEAGLERDSQKVDATKVATARKQKELKEVQQPTASGGAPAIAPETEDDKIIKDLQKANRDEKFKEIFG